MKIQDKDNIIGAKYNQAEQQRGSLQLVRRLV